MSRYKRKTCPECRSKAWDGDSCGDCAYGELRCPFCDEIVDRTGQNSCASPCACVAAWCAYGNNLDWEDADFKTKVCQLAAATDGLDLDELVGYKPTVSDVNELCAEDPDVRVLNHDDGAGHGHASGAWFIFVKRPKPSRTVPAGSPQ